MGFVFRLFNDCFNCVVSNGVIITSHGLDTTWNEIVVIERRVLTEFINTIHENLSKLAAT